MRRSGHIWTKVLIGATVLSLLTAVSWSQQPERPARYFLSGRDPDYHAVRTPNASGAQALLRVSLAYVTYNKPQPRFLYIVSRANLGGDRSDGVLGYQAAGFVRGRDFDVASASGIRSDGTDYLGQPVLDLNTVDFLQYDALVVASEPGWLTRSEVDVLIRRRDDIRRFLETPEKGLIAWAASHNVVLNYDYLPVRISFQPAGGWESGHQVTPVGASIGLTDQMVNGNWYHLYFTEFPAGWEVASVDASGRPVDIVPEPASLLALGAGLAGIVGLRRCKQ
jgi:hypothetical protein